MRSRKSKKSWTFQWIMPESLFRVAGRSNEDSGYEIDTGSDRDARANAKSSPEVDNDICTCVMEHNVNNQMNGGKFEMTRCVRVSSIVYRIKVG